MTEQEVLRPAGDFKDRKRGLILFGAFLILLGLLSFLMVPLVLIGALASSVAPQQAGAMPPGLILASMIPYLLLALLFFWLGIGSILARRWARALILVFSWVWLVVGILSLGFVVAVMPPLFDSMMERSGTAWPGTGFLMSFMLILMFPIYILLPGAFVLFYMGTNVKATCEHYDPKIRWTDNCPLPVLAASLLFGCSALFLPFMVFYRFTFPFFGTYLTRTAGAGVTLVMFLVSCYLCVGFYRLVRAAWWTALLFLPLGTISTVLTFSGRGLEEYYERAGIPLDQYFITGRFPETMGTAMTIMMILSTALTLGYLLFIGKYFSKTPAQ